MIRLILALAENTPYLLKMVECVEEAFAKTIFDFEKFSTYAEEALEKVPLMMEMAAEKVSPAKLENAEFIAAQIKLYLPQLCQKTKEIGELKEFLEKIVTLTNHMRKSMIDDLIEEKGDKS